MTPKEVFDRITAIMNMPNFEHVYRRFYDPVAMGEIKIGSFYYSAALQGEASEVFKICQHALRSNTKIDKEKVGGELVDVLWYSIALIRLLNIDFDAAVTKKCNEIIARVNAGYYKGNGHASEPTSV